MPGRKRNVHLHVMVTEDELAAIHARMAEAGISNTGAYVRKMALNGYILHVDLAPVKELVSLQRRCSNNLNQVAVHANTYGVYPEEIDGDDLLSHPPPFLLVIKPQFILCNCRYEIL